MSTYTDLHNKLKETINVDYRTRETNQCVKLQNERNEYWGTFKGSLNVEDSSISRASLSDVALYGNIAMHGKFIGGGISVDINQLTGLIDELSNKLYNEDNPARPLGDILDHANQIKYLYEAIDSLEGTQRGELSAVSVQIVQLVNDVKAELETRIDELSNGLSEEQLIRELNDSMISNNFMLALNAEQNARVAADDYLSALVLSVNEESKVRDKMLSEDLEDHKEDNAIQFKDLEDRLLSTIEHDRHYSIYDNDELIKTYPYELKDFAVNVLNASVKDALVLNKSNTAVASIINGEKTSDGKNVFIVSFYSIIDDVDILRAVYPGNQYELVEGIVQPTYKNDYTIAIRDNKLYLIHSNIPHLDLIDMRNGMPIGIIKPYLSTEADNLVSGLIDVDAKTSELSTFNKFHDQAFDNAELSVLSAGSYQIVFDGEKQQFTFRAGVFDIHYRTVQDANVPEVFGIIYKGDLSGTDEAIDAIAITTDGQKIVLQAPAFRTDYALAENACRMICCDIGTHVFEKYEVHANYQYGYYDATGEKRGNVILTAENRELYPLDFEAISVKLENTQVSALADQTFELKRLESEIIALNIWKCEVDWPDKDISATIAFNGSVVQINGIIDGATTLATYKVDLEDKTIANPDNAYTLKNRSVAVDWSTYPETIESCAASYAIAYQKPSREDILDDVTCQISADNLSAVDFVVPQGQTGVSREFILDTCISTLYPTKVKLNVESICKCKDPIQVEFNGLDAIEISSNTKMLLQFQEVESHKFIVTDLNNNFLKDQIQYLSSNLDYRAWQISSLSNEVSAISSAILLSVDEISNAVTLSTESISAFMRDDLSARICKLSSEVNTVSTFLSNSINGLNDTVTISVENLQSQINANDADIDYISSKTRFLLSTDKEHVAYQGTMSKYVPEETKLTANYYLSAFINQSLNPDFKGRLKLGFMFRLSAEQKDLVDANREKIYFGANDYFIINKDVMVANILTSDIDIIRDAQVEAIELSNQITSQINATSAFLTANVEYLSGQLSNTINDVKDISDAVALSTESISAFMRDDLSARICKLSSEVGEISDAVALSTESICACIELSVGDLQSQITSNDNDIANLQDQVASAQISVDNLSTLVSELSNGLSTETSALSEHYSRTFEKDVPIGIIGKTISADLLKLTDEDKDGKQYTLHLSAGTLVLIPIQ